MPETLKTGDVLLTSEAPMGEVAYLNGEHRYCLGQRLFALRGKPDRVLGRFLYYSLRSAPMQNRLWARLSGTTAQGIRQSELVKVEMALPPLTEQRRIAGVLGALDDKIEHNDQAARHLLEAAGLAVRAATQGCDETSIYEVATVTYGQPFSSGLFGADGVPVLRIRDLASGQPGIKTTERHPRGRVVREGDIVVGMDGEFRAYVWRGDDAWLNQRVCAFDPKPGVSRAFVLEVIKKPLAHFEATKMGATVIHLGKADIDTFRIPSIGEDAMQKLVLSADSMIYLAVSLSHESRNLRGTRDLLLPKLVSGEMRVSDSYDPDGVLGTVAEAPSVAV